MSTSGKNKAAEQFRKSLIRLETATNYQSVESSFKMWQRNAIEFGSSTKENLEMLEYIRYNRLAGFYLKDVDEPIFSIINKLNFETLLAEVQDVLTTVKKRELELTLFLINYFLIQITRENELILYLNKELSSDFFSYSTASRMRNEVQILLRKGMKNIINKYPLNYSYDTTVLTKKYKDSPYERVGLGFRGKDILLSEVIEEIENVDYEVFRKDLPINEQEWDAMTRFISLLFLSFERQII